ncbi:uncharacterized protein N7496_006410 [Penicillium cataractarum]|uniref:HD domain-containing protein n=1 Tax=Penicillium cataractarum TaxID=2100454 RepID=A0A9W9S643_9EURO|nr:uncharacterized protein N7496_006410 [Penicillium cataractarum]KAJ5370318.1 hypothetical protein N7496_006410 [Penicillium cataractarum]
MASSIEGLPTLSEIGITPPSSSLTIKAFEYAKQHCTETVYNHAIRSGYWATIIAKKLPEFRDNTNLNLEMVFISCILHDMGWANTPELLSNDKRFEVDGANIARDFLLNEKRDTNDENLNEATIQRVWDSIALHTTTSIARYAAPEVALTHLGITADFFGPKLPGPDGKPLISPEEYRAVLKVFPRAGFNAEGFKKIMCGLCRTKPATTFDNFVSAIGRKYGLDGNGEGKEEFTKAWEESQNQLNGFLVLGLDALEEEHDPK